MSKEQELIAAVNAAPVDREGRMTLRCADAFKVAEKLHVPIGEIGRICNEQKIKIIQCQLGCFK